MLRAASPEAIARGARRRAAGYLTVSIVALALDSGLYLALIALGTAPVAAAALGYGAGVIAHWFGSSRHVFAAALAAPGAARARQQALFVGSALAGLGITLLVVAVATRAGGDARLAKPLAVIASFGATWALRQRVVFARGAAR